MTSSQDIGRLGTDFRIALHGAGRIVGWAVAAAAVVWLLSGISSIKADQVGFATRFGKVVRKDIQPGLTFLLPWPIERLDTVPRTHVSSLESGFSVKTVGDHVQISAAGQDIPYCLTGDQNIIHISMIAWYQIKDPYRYLYSVTDADSILKYVLNDAIITCTAGMTIDGILTTEKEVLLSRTHQAAQKLLDELGAGLLIRKLQLETPPTVPKATEAAFQSVVDAKFGMQTARNHAEDDANTVMGEAEGHAEEIVQDARAVRHARVRQAESDAERFLAVLREYEKNKDITRLRMYLETMDQVMAKVRKYVLPAGGGRVGAPNTRPPILGVPEP